MVVFGLESVGNRFLSFFGSPAYGRLDGLSNYGPILGGIGEFLMRNGRDEIIKPVFVRQGRF